MKRPMYICHATREGIHVPGSDKRVMIPPECSSSDKTGRVCRRNPVEARLGDWHGLHLDCRFIRQAGSPTMRCWKGKGKVRSSRGCQRMHVLLRCNLVLFHQQSMLTSGRAGEELQVAMRTTATVSADSRKLILSKCCRRTVYSLKVVYCTVGCQITKSAYSTPSPTTVSDKNVTSLVHLTPCRKSVSLPVVALTLITGKGWAIVPEPRASCVFTVALG